MVPLCLSLAVLLCLSFTGAEPLRISLVRRRDPPSIEAFTRAAASLGGEYSYARSSIPKRELLADGADGVFLQGISPVSPCPTSVNTFLTLTKTCREGIIILNAPTTVLRATSGLEHRAFGTPTSPYFRYS